MLSSNKHRTTLKGERGAERVLVIDTHGVGSLWSYGEKPRSLPVLDVQLLDDGVAAKQASEIDSPRVGKYLGLDISFEGQQGVMASVGGVAPLTAADHARTQAHLRAHREAGGTVARAVGETLDVDIEDEVRREVDDFARLLVRSNDLAGYLMLRKLARARGSEASR